MGNIKIQGLARITIQQPHTMYDADGNHNPSRRDQTRQWTHAVMTGAFDDSSAQLIARVDVGWRGKRSGDAQIEQWIPDEWTNVMMWQHANAMADRIYKACGTSLAAQCVLDVEPGARVRAPRVIVTWIEKDVALM